MSPDLQGVTEYLLFVLCVLCALLLILVLGAAKALRQEAYRNARVLDYVREAWRAVGKGHPPYPGALAHGDPELVRRLVVERDRAIEAWKQDREASRARDAALSTEREARKPGPVADLEGMPPGHAPLCQCAAEPCRAARREHQVMTDPRYSPAAVARARAANRMYERNHKDDDV